MSRPSSWIFRSSGIFYIFMAFMVKCSTSRAREVAVHIQPSDAFENFVNAYYKKEQILATNYFRICGRGLVNALIKACTPTDDSSPCFQSSSNTLYADKMSNRSYRRGVATTCCDYGKCSQEYLATFCCEKLNNE